MRPASEPKLTITPPWSLTYEKTAWFRKDSALRVDVQDEIEVALRDLLRSRPVLGADDVEQGIPLAQLLDACPTAVKT